MDKFKTIHEKIVFNDQLIIEKGEITTSDGKVFARLRLKRANASAILILNTDSNKIVLTKQLRYAIASETSEDILEIVAGKIDEGEDPLKTAIRETEEEVGYRIREENIRLLVSCFSSPGYSSERFFIYSAKVNNSDKVSKGGGLESEHEHIDIIEMDVNEFRKLVYAGKISDAKTYIAAFHFFQIKSGSTVF